jgi:hypothetical protein
MKLKNISIDHIAAVDRPANRRPFLIVKGEQSAEVKKMEIKPLRTDEDIRKFINENYGSADEYYRCRFDVQTVASSEPEPVRKSEAEVCADYFQAVAKAQGVTLDKLFEQHPEEYRRYVALAAVRI